MVESVVGEAAALRVKIIVPPPQGGHEIPQAGDVRAGRLLQAADPGVERRRLADRQRLVRAEGGKNARGRAVGGDLFVMRQIVGRIIGGAEGWRR